MLFGDSDAMRTIQRTIHQLRNNDTTSVLITGETGVGKGGGLHEPFMPEVHGHQDHL